MFSRHQGIATILKEGTRTFCGLSEATFQNAEACKKLASMCGASFGPAGLLKLVINHLQKATISSCGRRIVEQAEVAHPAARIIDDAAKAVSQDFGDGYNTAVVMAGQLFEKSMQLLREGVHITELIRGFEIATEKIEKRLPALVVDGVQDLRDPISITKVIKSVLGGSRVTNNETLISLVANAMAEVMPQSVSSFDAENIRAINIPGGRIEDSFVIRGCGTTKQPSGHVEEKGHCKVLVLSGPLEQPSTETKGTVLIESSGQLMQYTLSEEKFMNEMISSIAKEGVGAIVSSGSISATAQHYCNMHGILTLQTPSKFEIRRIARAVGAEVLPQLEIPEPDQLGEALSIKSQLVASQKITVFESRLNQVVTLILRGTIMPYLEDAQFVIERCVTSVKTAASDGRLLPGGAALELALASCLRDYSDKMTTTEKHAVKAYAESLEYVATLLASVARNKGPELLKSISDMQRNNNMTLGLFIQGAEARCEPTTESHIYNGFKTRLFLYKFVLSSVTTVLNCDEIIMAKPAGGFKPRQHNDDEL